MSKRRWLMPLLILQTALIVLLAWTVVYLGRDEWRIQHGAKAGQDDDGADTKGTAGDTGAYTVKLSQLAQRMAGISISTPEAGRYLAQAQIELVVEPPPALAEPRQRLHQAQQEVAAANQRLAASQREADRQQALYDDERSTSQRVLEQAHQQTAAETLALAAAQRRLQQLQGETVANWGPWLGAALVDETRSGTNQALLERLSLGQAVLLRPRIAVDTDPGPLGRWPSQLSASSLPAIESPLDGVEDSAEHLARPVPPAGAKATATKPAAPAGRGGYKCLARSLQTTAAGSRGDVSNPGSVATPLYLCDAVPPAGGMATALLPGSRLTAAWPGNSQRTKPALDGSWLPAAAVVWQGGLPWVYLRTDSGRMAEKDDDEPAAEAEAASAAAKGKPGRPKRPDPGPVATFERRPLRGATRVGERWFVPGLGLDDPVVVRGAQLLLSEEHKFQIRNENDD